MIYILAFQLACLIAVLLRLLSKTKRFDKKELERNMMVALLSHRLRTPLTSIKWHTELLLNQEFGKLRISQMELLDKVNSGIADAIAVLNTFLEVSRVEQGAIGSKPVSIDVWDNIEGVVDEVKAKAAEKNQTITFPKPAERITAYMNPLIFHTIFEVIVDNAIIYTPTGGTIEIIVRREGKQAIIHVKDNGIGLTPAEQKKLFTKFFRGDKAKIISTNGNGLGLYLIKQLLATIGGSISCTSEAQKGTTFSIQLPTEKY